MKDNLRALSSVILIILIGVSGYFAFNIGNKSNNISVTYMVDNKVYEEVKLTKEENKISSLPEAPYKEGYTFKYWEYNGKEFDINEEIDGSIKITAVYEKDETTISPTPTAKPSNPVVTPKPNTTPTVKPSSPVATPKPNSNQTVEVTSISIPSSATIKVNEGLSLNVVVNPSNASNKTVTWTSSDTSIVIVSNGLIKGVKEGVATITSKSNNGKTATCEVTVTKQTTTNITVDVTGITLDNTSSSIEVGKKLILTATINPTNASNKTVTWTSSNTSIASVNSKGEVTGIKEGTVTITAKSNNGKTATCRVTVNAKTTSSSCKDSKIHFVRTGASDAFIVESCGHFGLVDSSNPYKDGTSYSSDSSTNSVQHVVTYLKKLTGCSGSSCKGKLEFVVGTHSHSDHIGGMPKIADVFVNSNTKYYYRKYVTTTDDSDNPDWDNRGYYNRAYNAMKNAGAQMKEITNKDTSFNFYDFTVKLMNTASVSSDELKGGVAWGENSNSIIQLITHKNGSKALLASDIEDNDERRVAAKIGKVNILKVGHHSISTSTCGTFLDKLKPEVLVVSNNSVKAVDRICYAVSVNPVAKIYITGSVTDAIVATFNSNGYTIKDQSGSNVKIQNSTYCSFNDGWYWSGSCWHYYKDKYAVTGWKKLNWSGGTDWFYFKGNGCMVSNTTTTIDGKSYKFDSNGVCTNYK